MAVTAAGQDVERPATVKVAAVQCSSDLGAVEANLAKLAFLIEEAARNGAKIIVLPETAVTGYLSQDTVLRKSGRFSIRSPGWTRGIPPIGSGTRFRNA